MTHHLSGIEHLSHENRRLFLPGPLEWGPIVGIILYIFIIF